MLLLLLALALPLLSLKPDRSEPRWVAPLQRCDGWLSGSYRTLLSLGCGQILSLPAERKQRVAGFQKAHDRSQLQYRRMTAMPRWSDRGWRIATARSA
ncbi:hypothetical protein DEU56DRAFT_811498 [Suillus clintonianus]|uniref:uncharacterized protein n=1 Tax=Suillus clintonianus TaxID=1904413 RepID=UPI001B87A88A|nr:uncharacterized protein DEU56DRAFT_811498 [Suillus clintonianus]KAG2132965.1 hypothetical protein DEU56DRAFT_811498 [Suillus clintonianus]